MIPLSVVGLIDNEQWKVQYDFPLQTWVAIDKNRYIAHQLPINELSGL